MVNMFKKCTAHKLLSGNETAPCFYCERETQYAMIEKDGCEIFCCVDCIVIKGKIKRFKNHTTLTEKDDNSFNLCVKNEESGVI